jgi:hypothetical protein
MGITNRRAQIKLAIFELMLGFGAGVLGTDLWHHYIAAGRPFYDTLNSTEFMQCMDSLVEDGDLVRDGLYYYNRTVGRARARRDVEA